MTCRAADLQIRESVRCFCIQEPRVHTYTVETRMTLWQLRDFSGLFDRESTRAVRALQVLEAVDGDTRGTGRELQQSGLRAGKVSAE
jgi:hypothetical protein